MRTGLARLCERAMAIMQLVCSNFLPKFQCSPSHKDLNDNAASADQSTIMTSTIIKTNLPGLERRRRRRAWRVCVCAKADFSGGNQKWWCEEDEKKLQLDKGSSGVVVPPPPPSPPKRKKRKRKERESLEREVLVPVLKIGLGSDPVLINLDWNLGFNPSSIPVQFFLTNRNQNWLILTCLALVLTLTSFLRMGVILQGGYIHLLFKSGRDPYKEGPSHLLLKRESDPYEQCSCCLKIKWMPKGRVLSLLRVR